VSAIVKKTQPPFLLIAGTKLLQLGPVQNSAHALAENFADNRKSGTSILPMKNWCYVFCQLQNGKKMADADQQAMLSAYKMSTRCFADHLT
jgi:hypothetical protein